MTAYSFAPYSFVGSLFFSLQFAQNPLQFPYSPPTVFPYRCESHVGHRHESEKIADSGAAAPRWAKKTPGAARSGFAGIA
jgi:hypothetical protein